MRRFTIQLPMVCVMIKMMIREYRICQHLVRTSCWKKPKLAKIAEHVLKISDFEFDADKATKGAPMFAENCASCHGEDGKGNSEFGAPNLADALWLYAR